MNNVVFTLFVYCYLVGMQSNYLFFLIHKCAGVSANITLVAVGGTVILTLLRYLLNRTFRLSGCFYSVSFFPVSILLLLLTPSIASVVVSLILLIIYVIIVRHNKYNRVFSSDVYLIIRKSLITMIVLFLCVVLCGMRSEIKTLVYATQRHIMYGDYEGALKVGEHSLATDSTLTFLRAYSLTHLNQLGERLFEYPLSATSNDLKFHGKNEDFFIKIDTAGFSERNNRDLALCALLMDKKLVAFVKSVSELNRGAIIVDSMPKHYREAIMLYNHLHINSLITYKNAVMQTNFNDFFEIQKKAISPRSKNNLTRTSYGDTYWWYYFYQ